VIETILANKELVAAGTVILTTVAGAIADMVKGYTKNSKSPYQSVIFKVLGKLGMDVFSRLNAR
jgi:hypothetical protein